MDVSEMYASKHFKGREAEVVHKRNVFLCALGRFPWGYVDEVGLLDSDFSAYNQIHAMLHDSNQCDQYVRKGQTKKIQPIHGSACHTVLKRALLQRFRFQCMSGACLCVGV